MDGVKYLRTKLEKIQNYVIPFLIYLQIILNDERTNKPVINSYTQR